MTYRRIALIIVLSIVLLAPPLAADGGMWPLYDLGTIPFDSLRSRGLELTPEQIFNPEGVDVSDAVIQLRGGTSSFVSPTGLIVTNHHVAFGAIQKASTVEQNYIRDGFYAATLADEIPAIGYYAYVTLAVEDVTERMMTNVNDEMDDFERHEAFNEMEKEILHEAEAGRDVKCKLAWMYGGRQFILYTYFKIKDIRIVYAPPDAIGNYGGDIDNWMWPRHVGDFSFVRAYVAPDGSSADFAPENVPYRPRAFLPISSGGLEPGDVTLLIGFPGKTQRYASSYQIDYLQNSFYPLYIETAGIRMSMIDEIGMYDAASELRLASKRSGISNYHKKWNGIIRGFERSDVLGQKRELERKLRAMLDERPDLQAAHAGTLPELEQVFAKKKTTYRKDFYLSTLPRACDMVDFAVELYTWAVEREKTDMDRESGYQNRDTATARDGLYDAQINYVPHYDQMVLRYFLRQLLKLPEGQRITAIDEIFAGRDIEHGIAIDAYVDSLYLNSRLNDRERRMEMFEMSRAELEASGDPFIDLAIALKPEIDEYERRDKEYDGALSRLTPRLVEAYEELASGTLYPDANSTMRFNYGFVEGYSPRDAVRYQPVTTLSGVMEKETGSDPFIVPAELRSAWERRDFGPYLDARLDDLPVNIMTSNSGTNGNSGSPVLNGRGELIGLDFDSSYDGVMSDYYYDPDYGRAIIVDSRYMLFIIDRVYHLERLLEELTIH